MQSSGLAVARPGGASAALARRRQPHRGRCLRRGTTALAAAAAHPFPTDRVETVRSAKTIYVRFDLNDYSIPPEAVGRSLTLVASDTVVRILDGAAEIARHRRTYDRHQVVLDPAHQDAVLETKRKASTDTGRPSGTARAGEQDAARPGLRAGGIAWREAAQLLKLLDQYGAAALRRAIVEALERNTPRASSVAFLLRRQPRSMPLALDLSRHPEAQSVEVRPHDLETYDELAHRKTTMRNSLAAQLQQIGSAPCPRNSTTFWRAPPRRAGLRIRSWKHLPRRNRRTLAPQPGTAASSPASERSNPWPTSTGPGPPRSNATSLSAR